MNGCSPGGGSRKERERKNDGVGRSVWDGTEERLCKIIIYEAKCLSLSGTHANVITTGAKVELCII